jgi:hypothetical protein
MVDAVISPHLGGPSRKVVAMMTERRNITVSLRPVLRSGPKGEVLDGR